MTIESIEYTINQMRMNIHSANVQPQGSLNAVDADDKRLYIVQCDINYNITYNL